MESVGGKFWSAGTAALFRCPQGPRHVGRRKERRGSWAEEEGALLLAVFASTGQDTPPLLTVI